MTHKSRLGSIGRLATLFQVRITSTRLLLATVLLLLCSSAAWAQSNGPADPSRELGAPKGSYSQSGYEELNLFNGRMNITVPLLDVVGRGGAKFPIKVPLQTHYWDVMNNAIFHPNGTITYDNVPFGNWSDLSFVEPLRTRIARADHGL